MTRRARRTAQADDDLIEIGAYIAVDNPAAAFRVTAELDARGELLAEFPEIGRRDDDRPGRRIFVVGSYIILYRELPDGVEILRYLHGRRNRRAV